MKLYTVGTKTINLEAIAWIDRKPYEKIGDTVGIVFTGAGEKEIYDLHLHGQEAVDFLSAIDAMERRQ